MNDRLRRKLKEIREKRGLGTIEETAALLGSSRRTVGDYERGHRLPDIDYLAKFSMHSGADLDELIRLRLEAAGFEASGSALHDSQAEYMVGVDDGSRGDVAAYARRVLLAEKELDPAWSLAIMEMSSRGQITPAGIDRLLEFVREWSLSDDRAWEWIESHTEEVAAFINEPDIDREDEADEI